MEFNDKTNPVAMTGSHDSSDTAYSNEEHSQPPQRVGQDQKRDQDGKQKIISISLSDPEHPNNWSTKKKALVLTGGIMTVIHSTLGSSLPSNAIQYIAKTFHVTSEVQMVLPISCFLMGYVFGPTLCGPLSENFGRKPVMLSSFCTFILWTMACALAPTWGSFLFFRFMCGMTGSAPIACVSGIFADINSDPRYRGRTMALFMAATTVGPVTAPPLSGFIAENITWRWVFGVATIFAACTLPFVAFMPETYAPVLTSKRAAKMRKETGDPNIVAKSDLQERSWKYLVTVVLTRPYRMLFQELIVSCVCVYLALCYGIFYLYFEAYGFIFQGPDSVYKWSPGIAGLAFLPIGIGAVICGCLYMFWDRFLANAQARGAPWSQIEEYRRLPLACIGGPLWVISLFWLGWSARPDVFWLAPVASGTTFGIAFLLIFMAMLNYLSDAYMTFSASAQGVASMCRSIMGVALPLAAHSMFKKLGINWACTLLGLLSLAVATIPFFFIKFGGRLRENSKFCKELRAMHEEELREKDHIERTEKEQSV